MSAQRGSVETSSWRKTWGPSALSRTIRENPRKNSVAEDSGTGVVRTGAAGSNGSGDYAIAFSTAPELRIRNSANARNQTTSVKLLSNEAMSPLFLAVIEATEEAIYNSLFRATTTTGRGHTVEALPIDRTLEILRRHGALLH